MDDIYEYIKNQENVYTSTPIKVNEKWEWKMYDHILRSDLYLNSMLFDGDDEEPILNIALPAYNLNLRATTIKVKNVGKATTHSFAHPVNFTYKFDIETFFKRLPNFRTKAVSNNFFYRIISVITCWRLIH